jgi:uncharacterized membrane protein
VKIKIYMLAAAVSAGAMIFVIFGMPDTVPIHFNYLGEADWWGSKWIHAIFAALPLAALAGYGFYRRAPRGGERAARNAPLEERVVTLTALFLAAIGWFIILQIRNGQQRLNPSTACLIFTAVGLLMMGISNLSAKIRPNRRLGFRVKWTLSDERVWVKTHRVAGYAGVVGGAIIVAGSLLGMAIAVWIAFAGFLAGMAVTVLIPMVYARNLYHALRAAKK